MKRLLAIETSAESCSVALDTEGGMLERFEHAPMQHAELILPFVSSLLNEAGMQMTDVDAVAFGRGPGSFTSLRIGIGVVQGLAWGADRPVIPVSSLAAVAQVAVESLDSLAEDSEIVVAMDARMQEVFHAVFRLQADGLVTILGEERVGPPGHLSPVGPWVAAGNGFERYELLAAKASAAQACLADTWPRASAVLKLARDWLKQNDPLPAALAQPVYIRNDVAEKPVGPA